MKKIIYGLLTLLFVVTLVSCTTTNEYSVTFKTDGAVGGDVVIKKAKDASLENLVVTKEGMTFGGWYTDIDLLEPATFPVKVTKNVTYYAKWVVTLSFDSQGGEAVNSITQEAGSFFTIPEVAPREGFVFVGWFTDKTYQTRLTYVMPKTNTTAYARWQVYEKGSAIVLDQNWADNDKAFMVSSNEEGTKFVATSAKAEWSYIYTKINVNAKANTTVVVDFIGTANINVVFKLEGGGADVTETSVVMTGEQQRLEWSVDPKNLTETGNQMFMIFLNGGVIGCGETPEYIQIKSVSLYRTLEATDEQKSAIYFNSNNGSAVETIYEKAGTVVTKPADPVKDGYIFKGWFTETTFVNEYVFDKMPETGVMLYAKWEAEEVILPDVDLMGEELVHGTEGAYTVTSSKDLITIAKNASGLEWDWVGFDMTDKAVKGLNMLRVAIKGAEGTSMMLKINDAIEKVIQCNGYVQHFEFPFDVPLDPAKKLIVFANPNVAGASETFEIYALSYGNYSQYYDLLGLTWRQNEDGLHTIVSEEHALTISKADTAGTEWHAILLDLPEVKLNKYNQLIMKIKGPVGEQLLVKVNDQGAGETWVTCTGEEQRLVLPFKLEFDMTKAALVLFANGGALGTTHAFTITELAFGASYEFEKPLIETGDINLLNQEIQPLDPTGYVVSRQVVINKQPAGGEWTCAAITLPEVDYTGINKLVVTLVGPKDQEIMFKVNDQGAGEKKVVCTGELQELSFDLDLVFDPVKFALCVFCDPGKNGTGEDFVITKLAYTGEDKELDLLKGDWKSLEEGIYPISKQVIIKKELTGTEWQCIGVKAPGYGFKNVNKLVVTLQGTAGEEMMFKINDNGGALEKKVLCDGTVQTVEFDFEHEFDASKAALIIFANPGLAGTDHEFVITGLTYKREEVIVKDPVDVNFMNGEWTSLDEGIYTTKKEIEISKATTEGEWSCIIVKGEETDYTGYNKLVATIKGTAGEEIMFKVNDSVEQRFTMTGEVQEISFNFTHTFDPNKATIVVFCNPGIAGTGNPFLLTKLAYRKDGGEMDLLALNWNAPTVKVHYTLSKVTTGTEWQCLAVKVAETDYTGLSKLVVTLKGTAGEEIMFKVNDQNAGEMKVLCTGEVQTVELEMALTIDPTKADLIVFCNPGKIGTGNEFVIYSAVFTVK